MLIATKVGMLPGEGGQGLQPDRIRAAADASLERLGVDAIDLYFAHKDDPDVPLDEVLGAFGELIDAGKVRAIGASNYSAERLAEALRIADEKGLPRFTVMQPELNLLDRDQFEGPLQQLCVAENIGVIPYYSLASGYLSGKYRGADDLRQSPRGYKAKSYMEGRGPAVLAVMDRIAAETGATLSQIALAWVARQPGVTAPIASATRVEQLDELLGSMTLELSDRGSGRPERSLKPGPTPPGRAWARPARPRCLSRRRQPTGIRLRAACRRRARCGTRPRARVSISPVRLPRSSAL